jgi:hypothetical protein
LDGAAGVGVEELCDPRPRKLQDENAVKNRAMADMKKARRDREAFMGFCIQVDSSFFYGIHAY